MTNLRMAINNDTKKTISIWKGSMVVFKHAHDIQDVNKIHWTKLIFAKKRPVRIDVWTWNWVQCHNTLHSLLGIFKTKIWFPLNFVHVERSETVWIIKNPLNFNLINGISWSQAIAIDRHNWLHYLIKKFSSLRSYFNENIFTWYVSTLHRTHIQISIIKVWHNAIFI